jgi:hypothetical protein
VPEPLTWLESDMSTNTVKVPGAVGVQFT